MSSHERLDIDALLQPIPGDNPAGSDLDTIEDGMHRWAVREARNESADIERKNREQPDSDQYSLEKLRWGEVESQCESILREHSKDFEIVAYLVEALVRQRQFFGLRDGLELARRLSEDDVLWQLAYPRPNHEGTDTQHYGSRIKALRQLLDGRTLDRKLKELPITPASGEAYTSLEYEMAMSREGMSDSERQQSLIPGIRDVTLMMFRQEASQASIDFCRELVTSLDESMEQVRALTDVLHKKAGVDDDGQPVAPSGRSTVETLQQIRGIAQHCYEHQLALAESEQAASDAATEVEEGGAAHATGPATGSAGQAFRMPAPQELTREMAFELLRRAEQYLLRAEPANPASFQIRKAIRCGGMTLPEILTEAIEDHGYRLEAFKKLGIDPPAEE